MNTLAKFLSLGSLALLATATPSFALDNDPSYNVGWAGAGMKPEAANRPGNRYAPQYLRPTQRYYGKGFTVAYRFVPWSDRMRSLNATSMWDSDQMRLPTNAAAATISAGNSPRVTYFHKRASTPPITPVTPATGLLPERNSAPSAIVEKPLEKPPVKPLPPIAEPTK